MVNKKWWKIKGEKARIKQYIVPVENENSFTTGNDDL